MTRCLCVCHGICVEVRKVSLFKTLEIHRLLSYCNYCSLFCILSLIDVYKINFCKSNVGRTYWILLRVSNIVLLQMFVITIYHCHTFSWTSVLFLEQLFYVVLWWHTDSWDSDVPLFWPILVLSFCMLLPCQLGHLPWLKASINWVGPNMWGEEIKHNIPCQKKFCVWNS